MLHAEAPTTTGSLIDRATTQAGIQYLYPYQRLVVANTLEPQEESPGQIVVLPTGSGKTLCFLVPASVLPGLTVIVYPLLALMDDQVRRMRASGLSAEVLRGGQPPDERERIFGAVRSGSVRCLITNPEVLAAARVREELSSVAISHFVLDEAHCVSEWGESFRPAYLSVGESIRSLCPSVTTAFTATASPAVLERVRAHIFGDRRPHLIAGNPDRPNIAYYTLRAPSKQFGLASLIGAGMETPGIVFCRSRKRVEAVARDLGGVIGWERVGAYHAGLSPAERSETEEWFMDAPDAVLVATCAYGMGVDKSNVRTVVHYDLPPNVESFLQESGRAGRDGGASTSVVLWNDGDASGASSSERGKQMWDYLHAPGCKREYLMGLLGAASEYCGGCDCCPDANARHRLVTESDGMVRTASARVVGFAAAHRRRYGLAQLTQIAGATFGDAVAGELVSALVESGDLRVIRRGPFCGRVIGTRGV